MKTHNDNKPDEEVREERDETTFDFWSDEGARHFNEALDDGRPMRKHTAILPTTSKAISRRKNVNTAIQSCATPTKKPSLQGTWS